MMATKSCVFRFGDVEVREREFTLIKAGEILPVEPKAFRVLLMLLRNPQKLISKEELLNAVWGDAADTENSLTRNIALLRKLLGDDAREPRYIETVATVGYRWVCKVDAADESSGAEDAPTEPAVRPSSETKVKTARQWLWTWTLACGGVLALGSAGTLWYLHRQLPPPRVTEYVQITTDGRPKILGGTDGSRLYFTLMPSTNDAPHSFGEVAVTGGEIAQIPIAIPGGEFLAVDVSRDGSSALIASVEKGDTPFAFWTASLVGGSLKRLIRSAQGAAFSPDGKSVAYTTQDGELWVMGSDGSAAHKVGPVGAGGAYMPAWSPDGKAISFQRGNRIWEVDSNGLNPRQMLPGWHDAESQCCGHWTADGNFFLFSSGELWGDRGQIWALDQRRGLLRQTPVQPIRLTLGPTRWGTPISSRDGKTIFAEGTSPHGELSRYDADSKQFHPFLKGISAEGVAFSGDGKSVAYVSYPDGTLWKANQDGSNPVQLSEPPIYAMNPRWSPDGSEILFMDISSSEAKSYIVQSEGGIPRRLLPEVDGEVADPNWSPDGKKIVFAFDDSGSGGKSGLRMLDVASGQVTDVAGSAGLFSPRWSPDGRTIAALTLDLDSSLKVFDTERRQWSVVVGPGENAGWPAFSRDSQFLYFLVGPGNQAVFRVRAKGGERERVVDLKDWHTTGHYDGWMALDPTDAPLLLRDNGTSDIYALTLEEK